MFYMLSSGYISKYIYLWKNITSLKNKTFFSFLLKDHLYNVLFSSFSSHFRKLRTHNETSQTQIEYHSAVTKFMDFPVPLDINMW